MFANHRVTLDTVLLSSYIIVNQQKLSFKIKNNYYKSNNRVFQQKFKERLGAQWAHITAQPEVDEAIAQVQLLNSYFERLEKLIARQLDAMHRVNDVDTEVSLYYKQEG